MKKYMILLITVFMCLSNITYAVDQPSSWALKDLQELLNSEVFREDAFRNYKNPITREEFIYIAVRVYEEFDGSEAIIDPKVSFDDTEDVYALKGVSANITSGVGDGKFAPDDLLTREQLAVLMVKAIEGSGGKLTSPTGYIFKDDSVFSSWSRDYIYKAKANGVIGGIGDDKFDPQGYATVEQALILGKKVLDRKEVLLNGNPIEKINQKINVYGKDIGVEGFIIDMDREDISIDSRLALDSVGKVESLDSIARRNEGFIAINGTYFSAYDEGEIKEPYGVIVMDGKLIHNGNDRAVIAFKDGKADIDRIDVAIKGNNGEPTWKYGWNGYWVNHSLIEGYPSLTVFTDARDETNTYLGTNYIIENDKITRIVKDQSLKIPQDGYVVNLFGVLGADEKEVYDRFQVGYPFEYSTILTPERGDLEFWNSIETGIGAGPALILDGKKDIDFDSEKFYEAKIKTNSAARSAIGYRSDGKLILIVTTSTIDELAEIMLSLGCYEAMNLDGGASSGLWYDGEYIRKPGRDISNALLIKIK
ncbi:MAG: phosphodiester glycosidase family protein [Firmicutes bacterium]|nr:phosphodiester glycosidase family protein [Bacillota bacterium]